MEVFSNSHLYLLKSLITLLKINKFTDLILENHHFTDNFLREKKSFFYDIFHFKFSHKESREVFLEDFMTSTFLNYSPSS